MFKNIGAVSTVSNLVKEFKQVDALHLASLLNVFMLRIIKLKARIMAIKSECADSLNAPKNFFNFTSFSRHQFLPIKFKTRLSVVKFFETSFLLYDSRKKLAHEFKIPNNEID